MALNSKRVSMAATLCRALWKGPPTKVVLPLGKRIQQSIKTTCNSQVSQSSWNGSCQRMAPAAWLQPAPGIVGVSTTSYSPWSPPSYTDHLAWRGDLPCLQLLSAPLTVRTNELQPSARFFSKYHVRLSLQWFVIMSDLRLATWTVRLWPVLRLGFRRGYCDKRMVKCRMMSLEVSTVLALVIFASCQTVSCSTIFKTLHTTSKYYLINIRLKDYFQIEKIKTCSFCMPQNLRLIKKQKLTFWFDNVGGVPNI